MGVTGMDWYLLPKLIATAFSAFGMLAVILGFPGTILAWIGIVIYALATRFSEISGWVLIGTFSGCLLFELADNLLSGVMVKQFGASKGSVVAAWLGGFGGAILGGLIGGVGGFIGSTIFGVIGAFVCSYAAVYFWELKRHNQPSTKAARADFGTVLGRLVGIFVKLGWIGWLLGLVW